MMLTVKTWIYLLCSIASVCTYGCNTNNIIGDWKKSCDGFSNYTIELCNRYANRNDYRINDIGQVLLACCISPVDVKDGDIDNPSSYEMRSEQGWVDYAISKRKYFPQSMPSASENGYRFIGIFSSLEDNRDAGGALKSTIFLGYGGRRGVFSFAIIYADDIHDAYVNDEAKGDYWATWALIHELGHSFLIWTEEADYSHTNHGGENSDCCAMKYISSGCSIPWLTLDGDSNHMIYCKNHRDEILSNSKTQKR